MISRVKACDFLQVQKIGASALFGAGVLLAAGSLNAVIAAPADAAPRPYASYGASAKAAGDRVARASTSTYTAYHGASTTATPAPNVAAAAAAAGPANPYMSWYKAPAAAPATSTAPSNKLKPTMVFFNKPIRGFSINSAFGLRTMGKRTRPHEGVDFAAPMGSPVLCAAEGRVVRTGTSSTYGRFVEVEHPNGVTSFYAHLSSIGVRDGATLEGGAVLGKVGSTGRSTGPHLHFEIRRNGQQVDPTGFLGRQVPGDGGFQVYKIVHGAGSGGGGANLRGMVAAE